MQRLERHDRVTGRQVLPQVDLANAEDARKRRPNGLARDGGADLGDPCLRRLLLGRRPVVIRPRDRALVDQALHALEVQAGEIPIGFDRGQLRLLLAGVELHEHVSLAHGLA